MTETTNRPRHGRRPGAMAATADSNAAILARLDAMSAQMAVMAEQVAEAAAAREQWSERGGDPHPRVTRCDGCGHPGAVRARGRRPDRRRHPGRPHHRPGPSRTEMLAAQIGSISERVTRSLPGRDLLAEVTGSQVTEDRAELHARPRGRCDRRPVVTTYTEDYVARPGTTS